MVVVDGVVRELGGAVEDSIVLAFCVEAGEKGLVADVALGCLSGSRDGPGQVPGRCCGRTWPSARRRRFSMPPKKPEPPVIRIFLVISSGLILAGWEFETRVITAERSGRMGRRCDLAGSFASLRMTPF